MRFPLQSFQMFVEGLLESRSLIRRGKKVSKEYKYNEVKTTFPLTKLLLPFVMLD